MSQDNKTKNTSKNIKSKKDSVNDVENVSVVYKSLDQVIHESMMPYSEFVIMDRALPRVEDGLKPVQRRVLYSMLEVGVTPDKPYRKSARIVGDCMGKYHPHGDKSIYDTMVRMAQDFNMREILVDGHGNYGSVDGDGAAAMRYTEARLSPISLELLKDIEKDTVSWSFNFDDSTKEPDMLPGRFPNLLVNGSTGIAVGLATNIPTHNLSEVIDATVAYIDNKNITLDDLMLHLPAPDFSTGGYILDNSEIKQIYETGKGKIVLRAKHHIEEIESGKKNIVITEIPYQVNKATMLQKIARLKESDTTGVFGGIYEIVDESDRNGTRAVIKVKKGASVKQILQALYKYSDMQINFNANIVAIAGGKPKQLSLIDIISYYVAYQKEVIYRRTKYDLELSEKREHILDGLLIAINNIDDVIKIIKNSKSTSEAKQTLMQTFYLSDVQAQAILDMRLARITNLEVNKLVKELNELKVLITKLKRILGSEKLQYNVVKTELLEIKEKYSTARKTAIVSEEEVDGYEEDEFDLLLMQQNTENMKVIYSANDTIKALTEKSYNMSNKEYTDGQTLAEISKIIIDVPSINNLYLFTNIGNCHSLKVSDIPVQKYKDKGVLLSSIIKNFELSEKVVSIVQIDSTQNVDMVFVTKDGMTRITDSQEFVSTKQSMSAIKLKDGDELIYADYVVKNNLSLFSKNGLSLSFEISEIPKSGRVSMGVKAMALADEDSVVSTMQTSGDEFFVVFMQNGNAKVVKYTEVPKLARARKGSRLLNIKDKLNKIAKVYLLNKDTNYIVCDSNNASNFVVNKKLVLDDKDGLGKKALASKNKSIKLVNVFEFKN